MDYKSVQFAIAIYDFLYFLQIYEKSLPAKGIFFFYTNSNEWDNKPVPHKRRILWILRII